MILAVLVTFGIVAIERAYLKLINAELRDKLKENIDVKIALDDFTQYAQLPTEIKDSTKSISSIETN